ncbi:putative GTP cyclohydrolase [Bacillus phage BSTP8]|nr:putative GTP cyclohydrolase I [Bacillus phage BSP7]QQO90101.1 GTP cyclohydrolase I/FolE [Bacillus phage BSTP5]QRI44309.1 putative GTP cyclohydrolase [Bacillus phage BSTP8]QRI44459.1 FolE [Bacillus phage BSTP10]QRI44507.1 FolE [Bacillus phage BSTP12]
MLNNGYLTEKQIDKLNPITGPLSHDDIVWARQAMEGIEAIIKAAGDNPDRDGLLETPFRVFKAFMEYTKGYREDPKEHLKKSFDVDHDDIVLVKDIPFNSLCEHHFAPFFGKVHIAYIPSDKITGLSKFARLTDGYANRFQVQERLTQEIADAIQEVLEPKAVAVIVEGEHYCMCGRGVKKKGAVTVTSTMRGLFRENSDARAEILNLLK